jgi:hypothetical protein
MGHVYLLKADRKWRGKNLVKIGLTNRPNVYDRISQIQQEWKHERDIQVDLIHSVVVADSAAVEAALHHKFKAPIRLYGKDLKHKFGQECNGDTEWFGMTDNQVRETIATMNQYAHQQIYDRHHPQSSGGWGYLGAVLVVMAGWVLSPSLSNFAAAVNQRNPVKARSQPSPQLNTLDSLFAQSITTTALANARNPSPTGATPIVVPGQTIPARTQLKATRSGDWWKITEGPHKGRLVHRTMVR